MARHVPFVTSIMGPPLLSPGGILEFPDAASLALMCEQLRERGQFDVQLRGATPGSIVHLLIQVPNQSAPESCIALLRPVDSARARLSLGRATADVLAHLQAAAESLRGFDSMDGSASRRPAQATSMRPATPLPAATSGPPGPLVAAPPAPAQPLPRPRRATTPLAIAGPLCGRIVRVPSVEDLDGFLRDRRLPAASDATHLVALVRHLSATRATGRLRLAGPRTKTFWIVNGQFERGEVDPPRREEPLNDLIDPWQLRSALQRQCEARLLEAAEWQYADYEFTPGELSPAGAAPPCSRMHMRVALARHVIARATPVEIQERFVSLKKQYARPHGIVELEEAALFGEDHSGALLRRYFPGTHRVREALSGCPLGRLPAMRLLLLLDVYGALQKGTEPLIPAAGTDPVGALRGRVLDAREQDHFCRLGAHHAMHADQIRDAYVRAKGDYAPGGRWQRLAPDAAATMVRMIEESFRVLGDSQMRRQYRRELLGEDRARYLAELLCARAHALAMTDQALAARPLAEVALELADLPEALVLLDSAGG